MRLNTITQQASIASQLCDLINVMTGRNMYHLIHSVVCFVCWFYTYFIIN